MRGRENERWLFLFLKGLYLRSLNLELKRYVRKFFSGESLNYYWIFKKKDARFNVFILKNIFTILFLDN